MLQLPAKVDEHESILLKAIETPRDTARTLYRLNEDTPPICTNPMFVRHPLLTVLGNLLISLVGIRPRIIFPRLVQLLTTECAALGGRLGHDCEN